jgi:hypothetical protein
MAHTLLKRLEAVVEDFSGHSIRRGRSAEFELGGFTLDGITLPTIGGNISPPAESARYRFQTLKRLESMHQEEQPHADRRTEQRGKQHHNQRLSRHDTTPHKRRSIPDSPGTELCTTGHWPHRPPFRNGRFQNTSKKEALQLKIAFAIREETQFPANARPLAISTGEGVDS